MTADLTIREAAVADAERLAAIYVAAAGAAWIDFIPDVATLEPDPERYTDALAEGAGGGTTTLVAVLAGAVLGFATVQIPSRELIAGAGELDMLYIDPDSWGCGVGQALNGAAIEQLRFHDCSCAFYGRPNSIGARGGSMKPLDGAPTVLAAAANGSAPSSTSCATESSCTIDGQPKPSRPRRLRTLTYPLALRRPWRDGAGSG